MSQEPVSEKDLEKISLQLEKKIDLLEGNIKKMLKEQSDLDQKMREKQRKGTIRTTLTGVSIIVTLVGIILKLTMGF